MTNENWELNIDEFPSVLLRKQLYLYFSFCGAAVIVYNDSTEILYLKYGATASTTSYTVQIPAGGYWEMPFPIYTGAIDGIWANNASGVARITELT